MGPQRSAASIRWFALSKELNEIHFGIRLRSLFAATTYSVGFHKEVGNRRFSAPRRTVSSIGRAADS